MENDKTEIRGAKRLMSYLKSHAPKSIGVAKKGFDARKNRVIRKTFKDFSFSGEFHDIEFRGVKFVDCIFNGVYGFFCIFQNCEFQNCRIWNSRFTHLEADWNSVEFDNCFLRNIEIDEGTVFNLTFHDCHIVSCTMMGLNPSENIKFHNCTIESSHLEGFNYYGDEVVQRDDEFIDLLFDDCKISSTNFYSLDLRNSRFIDSILYKASFFDCNLDDESVIVTRKLDYINHASLDFQTILKSAELSEDILLEYFNIKNNSDLKTLVSSVTTAKTFSTVFISYSFKDSLFAKKLNDALNSAGIRTFMWEKDAPVGKTLEEIMITGVTAHDKLLFIASEHSIKSKACQFELTTARKKQEVSWENIFFPIFIDRYLFQIAKHQIRPLEYADQYWGNIEEIKRVNALDFCKFNGKEYPENEFIEQVLKIIDGLKVNAR